MKYNYFIAKTKFDREWKKLEREYAKAGMDSESIEKMREFDWRIFKSNRIYALHTSDVPMSKEDEFFDVPSVLALCPYARIATPYDTYGAHSRYWWLEEIENPCLTIGIGGLSQEEKELLTQYVLEQKTEEEIAVALGVHRSTVSRRLQKIFSRFKETP